MLGVRREKKFGGITVAGVRQKEQKSRGSQLLVLAALLVTVCGLLLAVAVDLVFGLFVTFVGFACLIALTAWAIRNWDWER
jgi:protein-S-isoprenylcysteine O-methyltransferase Ste14